MNTRPIVILGSTGSIGQSTLDVVRQHRDRIEIRALAAHSSVDRLVEQYREFHPKYLCLTDTSKVTELEDKVKGQRVEVLAGEEEMIGLTALQGPDMVVNAVVGAAGLRASLETIKNGKNLALANKESLVAGGPLFPKLLEKSEAHLLPIDSEHSAIWQVLNAGQKDEVRKIILTASGGPFRDLPAEEFDRVTVDQALDHPTWNMGPKITIDSATLANKGLEVIEAVQLFNVPADQISVVVHPQSIIHSMVEFRDSAVIAQLSNPDMRLPISYALFWPERLESEYGRIDWSDMGSLTFEKPDYRRFPMLKAAFEVAAAGGVAPAVYNAANEVAVAAFLDRRIKFTEIYEIVRAVLDNTDTIADPSLDDILSADADARARARHRMENITV